MRSRQHASPAQCATRTMRRKGMTREHLGCRRARCLQPHAASRANCGRRRYPYGAAAQQRNCINLSRPDRLGGLLPQKGFTRRTRKGNSFTKRTKEHEAFLGDKLSFAEASAGGRIILRSCEAAKEEGLQLSLLLPSLVSRRGAQPGIARAHRARAENQAGFPPPFCNPHTRRGYCRAPHRRYPDRNRRSACGWRQAISPC